MKLWGKKATEPSRPPVRCWAKFRADFPDDTIEGEERIIRFGGCNVAAAIGEILRTLGATSSEPEDAGDHGWELDVKYSGRPIVCQISSVDCIWLLCYENRFRHHRGTPHELYLELLSRLSTALLQDGRFHDIAWYTVDDFDKPGKGAPSPFDNEA